MCKIDLGGKNSDSRLAGNVKGKWKMKDKGISVMHVQETDHEKG